MTTSWSGTRRSFPTPIRTATLARDPWCQACGQRPSTIADHIIPWAEGGPDTLDNAQGLCDPCHKAKTIDEQRRGRARRARQRPSPAHPGVIGPDPHPGG